MKLRSVLIGIAAVIAWMLVIVVMVSMTLKADAAEAPTITVDGVTYEATKISGPTTHFETPDSFPKDAFTERNVWAGHGSEHLPCQGGIHWIENNNNLLISHCLAAPAPTTTTSVAETTTTTGPSTTTTTLVPSSSTTTARSSTTTVTTPPTTATTEGPTTTSAPPPSTSTTGELPYTGAGETGALAALALVLVAWGALMVRGRSE